MISRPVVPVLLLVRELHLGGTERQLTETAKALDRSRFEPHVGCFRPEGLRGRELEAAGVPVVQFPVHSFRHPSVLWAARQLARYVRDRQILLVHTFDVPATLFGVPAARFGSSAKVLSSQRAHRDLVSGATRRLLRITDRMVDGIVANCEAVRRELVEMEGVPDERIFTCYNGIDTAQFHPAGRFDAASPGGVCTIGTLAALRPEKDFGSLVAAFAELRRRRPDVRLLIVGSGPCLDHLKQQTEALGVAADCTFEPATRHVAEWLRKMDVFVLPSRSEALSNSLMEAMACGCAVVASRVGGNPELVSEGETGFLYESGNVPALAALLERLAGEPRERRTLAQAAAAVIRDRFSLDRAASRMGEIYAATVAADRRMSSKTPVT